MSSNYQINYHASKCDHFKLRLKVNLVASLFKNHTEHNNNNETKGSYTRLIRITACNDFSATSAYENSAGNAVAKQQSCIVNATKQGEQIAY